MKTFSETINIDPAEPISVASGPIDFENKVHQVLIKMKELGYEPNIMQVRDFIRGIKGSGNLINLINQITRENLPAPFSEKINTRIAALIASETINVEDPGQWQKLLKDIRKWRKTGGTLKAKLVGEKDEKIARKRIEELVAQRGPKLTSEEMDEISAIPGIIPPWWSKKSPHDSYYTGARKAIRKLGVSALDVHIAVERDYTEKPLNEIQEEILEIMYKARRGEEND